MPASAATAKLLVWLWFPAAAETGSLEAAAAPPNPELLAVRRVHVDRMAGGETAAHIRDMVIASLQRSGLFLVTENPERADAFLRGSAEDLVFTDTFQSSDSVSARVSAGMPDYGDGSRTTSRSRRTASASVGQNESVRIAERKHEAAAAIRLVNKDGDVIWSTTQESLGAKFRGASADVAAKIVKQLTEDFKRARAAAAGQAVLPRASPPGDANALPR